MTDEQRATELVAEMRAVKPAVEYKYDPISGTMKYYGTNAPNGWVGDGPVETPPSPEKVKPLEWAEQPSFPAESCWMSKTPLCSYTIDQDFGSDAFYYEVRRSGSLVGTCDGLPEAKEAAQADYSSRILSALNPEYLTTLDAAVARAEAAERDRDVAYAKVTCMCGSYIDDHGMGDGHSPVSMYDHALVRAEERAEAAEKALGEARVWQPIETAPNDGTPVDLWAVRGECGDAGYRAGDRYADCRFARRSFGSEPYGEPVWIGLNDRYIKVTPTHWMPIAGDPASTPARALSAEKERDALREALAAMQTRAMSTRGEQAYRELPKFIIKAARAALNGRA
jgi:hypothetical protein